MSTHPGFLYSSDNSSHQLVDAVLGESESNALPTYGLLKFTISTFIAAALWHLIRLRYPCITTAGLNSKEKKVDELYEDAIEKDSFTGPTLEDITRRRIERVLKAKASQIRTRSLAMASSIWLIYFDFHPKLVDDLSKWYKAADILERDIQSNIESDIQHRYRMELQRRTGGQDRSPNASAGTSVVSPASGNACA
ncbi:hypothetical protein WG66_009576 [Moniliophthora roreri]|uniref:Uncharacterized protein n=1 Tax=Moniliophthora roreri TaxID=221103 RepID=A0A0W0GF74_MONRR|nr:hypothetical protein WG66_009576 [Moniliophthora roreri]